MVIAPDSISVLPPATGGQVRSDRSRHLLIDGLLIGLALVLTACATQTAAAPGAGEAAIARDLPDQPSSRLPDFSVTGLKADQVRTFFQALKSAVARDDRQAVASLVSYPITVRLGGQPTRVETAGEFVTRYPAIMTAPVREAVERAQLASLFVNYQGVRLGQGEIWFGGVYPEGKETYELRILAINN